MIPEGFHFLRPWWLLALLPAALLVWSARRSAAQASAWRRVVDAHLLRHLLVTADGATRRWPLAAAAAGLAATCVALAGPAWERVPQPALAAVDPTVVALDMSPAMYVDDPSPSRLARARHELQDVLDRARGGQVALVLYADEPFVAAPLTDDARVVEELIPTLERGLMPPRAARTDRAIAQAQALLEQAGVPGGRILLLTADAGAQPEAALAAARRAAAAGQTVSVLGIGSEVPAAPGAPALDGERLAALAQAGGGRFAALRVDDADVAALLPKRAATALGAQSGSSAQADAWHDTGAWLVLIPLLLAPLAFRRGLVVALALAIVGAAAAPGEASVWDDLWSRRDQQAQAALAQGDPASAAQLFEDPAWRAAARYESGAFEESVAAYRELPGTDNRYNLGNALARAGRLEDAIAAYDEVLASAPTHDDARFNRDLIQQLLDRQQQQQQQQQQGDGGAQEDAQQGGGESGSQQAAQGGGAQSEPQPAQGGESGAPQDATPDGAGEHGDEAAAPRPEDQPTEQPAGATQTADAATAHDDAQHAQPAAAQPDEAPDTQPEERDADQRPREDRPAGAATQQAEAAARGGAPHAADQQADEAHDPTRTAAAEPHDPDGADDAAAAPQDDAAGQDRTLAERLADALRGDGASDEAHDEVAEEPASEHASGSGATPPLDERAQAREQMLRRIPDDPGGLLRAKIRRRYAEQRYAREEIAPW